MIDPEIVVCKKCDSTVFEKIEVNRYTALTCMGKYVKPWILLKCIKCGGLESIAGHADEELDKFLNL